ncbi:MAG: nucleotide disphospho-sugar-binding domain-containing protein [Thiohalocapsa sp.]
MKVLLLTFGSAGDIYPFIRLGQAMTERGHQIRLACPPAFQEEAMFAGLKYIPLPRRHTLEKLKEEMLGTSRQGHPLFVLRRLYKAMAAFMHETAEVLEAHLPWADILVTSFLCSYLKGYADRARVPFVLLGFLPTLVPDALMPPTGLPELRNLPVRLRRIYCSVFWRLADWVPQFMMWRRYRRHFSQCGVALNNHLFLKPAERVLIAASPAVVTGANFDRHRYRYTGYLRWQKQQNDTDELERLKDFLKGRKAPVITFGSVIFDDSQSLMDEFLETWPDDKPLVIQRGWADFKLPQQREQVHIAGPMSHDALFAFATCIVHHGGAGTTGSALSAGVPQVVVPHLGDQFYWAAQVTRLRCGVKLARTNWPQHLAERIRNVLEPPYTRSAGKVAQQLTEEDGPANAVRELESFVAEHA